MGILSKIFKSNSDNFEELPEITSIEDVPEECLAELSNNKGDEE